MKPLKHYTRYLISEHRRRIVANGKTLRRYYCEVAIVVLGLMLVLLLSTLITPYNPALETTTLPQTDAAARSQYYRARIDSITGQTVRATVLEGPQKDTSLTVNYPATPLTSRDNSNSSNSPIYRPGEVILLGNTTQDKSLFLIDHYRIPGLLILSVVFAGLVLVIGGRQGVGSIIGLVITVMVIGWFVIPFIVAGYSPLLICVVGAYLIALASITIAHGFKRRTFLSVACVAIILAIVACLAQVTVMLLNFTGLADEIAYQFSNENPCIDMRGILVGGIIIASLGVLDDIVTAQVATVDELQKANKNLDAGELFRRASSVGKEHISALVNTLALVYVGAALPAVVAMSLYPNGLVYINSEYIASEIARTLVASIGLVLAVPISTVIASLYLHHRQLIRQINSK